MYLKDPKTGKKSVTMTMMIDGYCVALLKLLFAGMTYKSLTLGAFAASDFAIIIGALGALYAGRKYTDKEKE